MKFRNKKALRFVGVDEHLKGTNCPRSSNSAAIPCK